jgi:hypothetical protein
MSRPDPTTRLIPPCKDCTERYTACHDHCEKFKKYKAIREKENEARRKYNFESAIFSKIT